MQVLNGNCDVWNMSLRGEKMENKYVDSSKLHRSVYPLPDDILAELSKRNLLEAYKARPDYQKNDYIGWISRAKRMETREKKIESNACRTCIRR